MTEIIVPEVKNIELGKIIADESNPNKMSESSFKALKEVIKKYGFIIPIITNKDLKIADGYHRHKAARELGLKEVPVIALNVNEVDRRLLRQILNKLKGEHDLILDQEDFKFLDENNSITELMNLIPSEEENIKDLLDEVSEKDAFNKIPEGDKGNYEQITFTLKEEQAMVVKSSLREIQKTELFNALDKINENKNGNAIWLICKEWEKQKKF